MLADEFKDVFTSILDPKIIASFSQEAKVQERERKKDVQLLLRSMIMAAANGEGGHLGFFEHSNRRQRRTSRRRRLITTLDVLVNMNSWIVHSVEADVGGCGADYVDEEECERSSPKMALMS